MCSLFDRLHEIVHKDKTSELKLSLYVCVYHLIRCLQVILLYIEYISAVYPLQQCTPISFICGSLKRCPTTDDSSCFSFLYDYLCVVEEVITLFNVG